MNKKQAEQSLNIFDLIDQLCGEFRQQWKAALQPQIESFLSQVPTEAQVTLFRNLLTLDVRLRQAAKQAPKSHEYKQRFPQFAKVIRETFLEPTLTSDRDAQDTSEGHSLEATVTVEPPAAHRIGDYELIRELGRGGFGVVYEARHLKRCDRVALKTLQTGLDGQQQIAERLHHFRREFRSLTELNHPNLIGMQTLEVDGKQWFLTMDLVEPAVDFVEYVRPGGDLDESRLRRCLEQLLRGITALHERGILHRDLKPSNVLVDGDGNLVILDFGLVTQKEAHVDQTVTAYANRFAGTPKYAAPEQFRGNFSAASDLYAVGTMLFIALSGKSPFEGDFAHLFCVKQEQDAAGLAVQDGLPTDLAELTDRLLKREPEERPDLASIQHALGLADESARSISRGLSGSSDRSEVLVGRSHQLAQLEQAYRTLLEERRSQAVFVSGRSGEGKSSLVAKFLEPLRLNDKVVVLSGRCYDRESVPFKALDGVIDALSRHMRSRSFEELADWLPRDTTLLAQLFPALRRVEAIASLPTPPTDLEPDRIRHRGFYALRELMRSASTKTPWVLFIDDLQWGDADSAQALFELLTCEPPVAILLVGCYRKDEAEKSEFLQTWQELEPSDHPSFVRIEVGPLTAEECLEVAAIRLGRPPQELSAWSSKLLKDTGGNPYFLDQLLEGFDVEGGEISAIPLGEIIDHRLGRLPTQAESLLQTIAVSGQALAADEAAQATGFAPSALPVLTRMRSEKLVRLIGREGASIVDTYHDKIRETVLAGLAENDRRRIHRQLAETIEAQDDSRAETLLANYRRRNADFEATSQAPPRVFDLAYHFQEAADPRACIYQVLAGEQALKAFAPKEALEHLSIAQQRLPPDVSAELRFALEFHLAEAFRQENRIGEATSQFQHALEFASDEDDRAEALIGLGDVFERQSNYPQATGCYDQALSAIGWKRPQSVPGKLLLAVRSFVRVVPAWETQRRTIDPSNCFRSRLAHDVYHRMNVYMQDHQPNDFVLLALHSALTAWHVGDRTHRAAANIHAAFFLTLIGLGWLGRRLQARADTAMEDGQALQLQALSTMKNAGVLYLNGQHREAASAFRSAAEFAERCGDYTSRNMALMTRGLSERWFVATCEEIDLSNQLLDSISNHEDPRTAAFGHHTQASALARRGELSEALLHAERAKQAVEGKTIVCETIVLYGMAGFVHLQGSNYKQAYEELSHAWDMACRFRAFFPFNVYSLSWILEAEAGPNWASKDASPTRRTSTRRQLAARALARVLPGNRPQLWRALGRQRAIQGRHRASIRYFQAALRLARKQDLTFEVAKILLDLAAVKEEGRQGNRTEAVRLLKQSESVIPRAEAWLLGEQYDEDAVTPEFDLEAWERLYGPMLRATKN